MTEVPPTQARYRARRRGVAVLHLVSWPIVGGTYLLHLAGLVGPRPVVVAMAAFGGVLLAHFLLWLCPGCVTYLQASFFDAFCPRCGVPLGGAKAPPQRPGP